MTEETQEVEDALETGPEMAKAGSTLFSFAGFAWWGALVGFVLSVGIHGDKAKLTMLPVLVVLIPFVIAVIIRSATDKEIVWHKWAARIAGLVIGFLSGFVVLL